MTIWKSPFNKIVRSHEAGIVGLLAGIMIGVAAMIFVPVVVTETQLDQLPTYCESGISSISFSYVGRVTRVQCKNGQIIDNF